MDIDLDTLPNCNLPTLRKLCVELGVKIQGGKTRGKMVQAITKKVNNGRARLREIQAKKMKEKSSTAATTNDKSILPFKVGVASSDNLHQTNFKVSTHTKVKEIHHAVLGKWEISGPPNQFKLFLHNDNTSGTPLSMEIEMEDIALKQGAKVHMVLKKLIGHNRYCELHPSLTSSTKPAANNDKSAKSTKDKSTNSSAAKSSSTEANSSTKSSEAKDDNDLHELLRRLSEESPKNEDESLKHFSDRILKEAKHIQLRREKIAATIFNEEEMNVAGTLATWRAIRFK